MDNKLVEAEAKAACRSLVFIAEKTDKVGVRNSCNEMIGILCSEFNITIFGSLPNEGVKKLENAQTENNAAGGLSDSNAGLERIAIDIMGEWGVSLGGIYIDFAVELAKRAVAIEREECAKLVDKMQDELEPWMCGDDIRMRSNEDVEKVAL